LNCKRAPSGRIGGVSEQARCQTSSLHRRSRPCPQDGEKFAVSTGCCRDRVRRTISRHHRRVDLPLVICPCGWSIRIVAFDARTSGASSNDVRRIALDLMTLAEYANGHAW